MLSDTINSVFLSSGVESGQESIGVGDGAMELASLPSRLPVAEESNEKLDGMELESALGTANSEYRLVKVTPQVRSNSGDDLNESLHNLDLEKAEV